MKSILQVCLLVVACWMTQEEYPVLKQIVTDKAEVFSQNELETLRSKLYDFEAQTTNQVVVLTIPNLGNETIEQYANGTFNQNRLGQKEKDNGILILFARDDREVRIEVGYGLEPIITDAIASRIIRNSMIPEFKQQNHYIGIAKGADTIMELLSDPKALEEFKEEMDSEGSMNTGVKIFMLMFLSIFIAAGGFIFYKSYRNLIEVFRGMFIGKLGVVPGFFISAISLLPIVFSLVFVVMPLVFAALIWGVDLEEYVYLLDHPFWFISILLGFFGIAMLLALLKIRVKGKDDFKLSFLKSDSTYMSKTFSSGGTHSFGSSSGGGSSSSFSGGGGSSGGGGASGSW